MVFSFFFVVNFVVNYESQGKVTNVGEHLDCLGFAYGFGQVFRPDTSRIGDQFVAHPSGGKRPLICLDLAIKRGEIHCIFAGIFTFFCVWGESQIHRIHASSSSFEKCS